MFTYEFNGATVIPQSVPRPDPKGRLDRFMSPRVGDFTQKIIADLVIPGGTLDVTTIMKLAAYTQGGCKTGKHRKAGKLRESEKLSKSQEKL